MFEYDYDSEDKALKLVGLELMFLTPEKYSNPEGITAVELAKRVNLGVDIVKKKLKILYEHDIIRCSGINPKYWNMGYGKQVLKLGLEQFKHLIE